MDVIAILDEMDEALNARRRRVDLRRIGELMDELKTALPPLVKGAEDVIRSRDRILGNADVVAKNVIREAEERAKHLAESSEVTRLAKAQGGEMIDRTYRECDSLIRKTKEHLDATFAEAERFLQNTLDLIKTNRNELRALMPPGGAK